MDTVRILEVNVKELTTAVAASRSRVDAMLQEGGFEQAIAALNAVAPFWRAVGYGPEVRAAKARIAAKINDAIYAVNDALSVEKFMPARVEGDIMLEGLTELLTSCEAIAV